MRRQLLSALGMTVALTALLGLAYPLAVTGISQTVFPDKANGSVIRRDGKVVGSALLGQAFTKPQYFLPRPSAAGNGYDGLASSASNLGPSSEKLLHGQKDDPATKDVDESFDGVQQRVAAYRTLNGLSPQQPVPVDAVTASGSGLDPGISIANARLQAPRVARRRGVDLAVVRRLIGQHTTGRSLGVLGEKTVNVLQLNLALDRR